MTPAARFFRHLCLKSALACTSFLLALSLSWVVLAQFDFLYSVWHDHGGIKEGIEKYGPKNRYKLDFEHTSKEERLRLFAEINHAVHHHGEGLEDIRYSTEQVSSSLLRHPEIVHLQDVANLIDKLRLVVFINILCFAFCILVMFRYVRVGSKGVKSTGVKNTGVKSILSWSSQFFSVIGGLALTTFLVLLIGPEKVFNQFHIWIFPKDHEWFFYYQDSLMSTMMLAPLLFAWIAVALLLVTILFFSFISFLLILFERKVKS